MCRPTCLEMRVDDVDGAAAFLLQHVVVLESLRETHQVATTGKFNNSCVCHEVADTAHAVPDQHCIRNWPAST